jgi:nuclear pore complex protein Nup98-Nup96
MDKSDRAFHDSQKPSWGPDGTLIYARTGEGGALKGGASARMSGSVLEQKDVLVSEGKDICFVNFTTTSDVGFTCIASQDSGY